MSDNQVERIAHLARIKLDEKDIPGYDVQFKNIVELIEQVNALNVEGLEPLSHTFDTLQPMREDVVTELNQRDLFQKIAPDVKAGLYLVPKVIEES